MNKQDLIARIVKDTGATIRIPKRKAVRFPAGKALKKAVN